MRLGRPFLSSLLAMPASLHAFNQREIKETTGDESGRVVSTRLQNYVQNRKSEYKGQDLKINSCSKDMDFQNPRTQ